MPAPPVPGTPPHLVPHPAQTNPDSLAPALASFRVFPSAPGTSSGFPWVSAARSAKERNIQKQDETLSIQWITFMLAEKPRKSDRFFLARAQSNLSKSCRIIHDKRYIHENILLGLLNTPCFAKRPPALCPRIAPGLSTCATLASQLTSTTPLPLLPCAERPFDISTGALLALHHPPSAGKAFFFPDTKRERLGPLNRGSGRSLKRNRWSAACRRGVLAVSPGHLRKGD